MEIKLIQDNSWDINMQKTIVEKHFDKVASSYDMGKEKYSYYYNNLKKMLKLLIGDNKSVFEVGCGTGDLLASLNPKLGYGMDISVEMIGIAKFRHGEQKKLEFSTRWPDKKYEYIFMSDVIEHLEDVENTFIQIKKMMGPKTLFINTMANPLWEPMLVFWEIMGWKMEEGPHKRISYKDTKILSEKIRLKIIKHDYKLLIPIQIPFITNFANKYLEKYLKPLCFIEYFVFVKS